MKIGGRSLQNLELLAKLGVRRFARNSRRSLTTLTPLVGTRFDSGRKTEQFTKLRLAQVRQMGLRITTSLEKKNLPCSVRTLWNYGSRAHLLSGLSEVTE